MENDEHPRTESGEETEDISLLDILVVLLKRKKFIGSVTIGITLLTVIVSLTMTKIYRAESRILPPSQSQSTSSQLLAQLSGMVGGLNLQGLTGAKNTNDLYMGLVRSRPVVDAVIDRFRLQALYHTPNKETTRRTLLNNLVCRDDKKSGIIMIAVEDKDPARAAAMANMFVEELKNLNGRLALTEASQRRLFYEEQVKSVRESMAQAEESMKAFQERTGAINIEEQAKATMQGIGEIRAQIAAREVQLRVMRTYVTQRNPDAKRLEEEISGLREQLTRLQTKGDSGPDPLVPTGRVPQLGTDYIRKMRNLKFNEALYEILVKQLEAAKLDEARDANIIQVIESAVPPEMRIRPKRSLMVIIAFFAGLFCSFFGAFFLEYAEKAKSDPTNNGRVRQLNQLCRTWRKKQKLDEV